MANLDRVRRSDTGEAVWQSSTSAKTAIRRPRTALERAFELASSGNYQHVQQIRDQLKAEGFYDRHLVGGTLIKQLVAILRANRPTV